jgi:lysozyme
MTATAPAPNAAIRGKVRGLTSALLILLAMTGYFEGNRLVAYRDIGGVPTICGGITAGVRMGQVATEEQCHAMNTAEAQKSLAVVDRLLKGTHPDTRRAALADFEYNVGEGAFARSTLLRKLNSGDIHGGCDELSRWVFVAGKRNAWQVQRREFERELCLDGLAE